MNTDDDQILHLLLQNFTTEHEHQFVKHFQLYLQYGTQKDRYVIDLDEIWSRLGFNNKGNAKKHLQKFFVENTDFVVNNLLVHQNKQHGGHNKEQVLLNVDTFKAFCMTVNTEKGKQTRQYYIKMENVFFQYMDAKNKDTIQQLQLEHKRSLEQERHENLRQAHRDTPCVYIFKVSQTADDNMIVKLGETDDLVQRTTTLRQEYKECLLLDVFPCMRPHTFEQYLLNRNDIKGQRIPNSELIQIDPTFPYTQLVKIMSRNVEYFNKTSVHEVLELNRLKVEQSRCQELMSLTHNIQTCQDEKVKSMFMTRYKDLMKLQTITTMPEVCVEPQHKHPPSSHRKVYKFDPSDLRRSIAEFPSLREAARSLNDPKIHDYHLRNASSDNELVAGYRWYYVDDNEGLPEELPATKEEQTKISHRKGLVAQISQCKTYIVNIFPSQNEAAAALKMKACSITTAITKETMSNGYFWRMFEDCDKLLKSTFHETIPKPHVLSTCSKRVERIDPDTDSTLEVYSCIQDVCNMYKTSHKTIHKVCKSGDIFRGFKWKLVERVC